MSAIEGDQNPAVRTIARILTIVNREARLTLRAFADLPGALAGHRGETAQVFAKHTAIMLFAQFTSTVVLMIWIAIVT